MIICITLYLNHKTHVSVRLTVPQLFNVLHSDQNVLEKRLFLKTPIKDPWSYVTMLCEVMFELQLQSGYQHGRSLVVKMDARVTKSRKNRYFQGGVCDTGPNLSY